MTPSRALPVLPLAGLVVLWVVRPGVVENAARSPVAWAVAAGGVAGAVGVRAWATRLGASALVARSLSTALVVVLVAVVLAPSFRQRTLVEELPADVLAGPTAPSPGGRPASTDSSGRLEGIGHAARGTVHLRTGAGATYLVFDDVDIEGTVGPSVHLVAPGRRSPSGGIRVGDLKAEKGTFSYRLPAHVDVTRAWSVLVWCDPYDTPIARADPR